jgi:tetratricopeptide (TPR) repeat protein
MSTAPERRSILPFVIGGLCVVLAALVWQVIPRQAARLAPGELPTSHPEASPADTEASPDAHFRRATPLALVLELKALAEAEPPNVDAVIELGRFSIQSGQLDKAKERFVQAIDLAPDRAEPLVQLGMLELDGGNPAEALIHFERAVLVDSTAHNAWFFQAQCHERLGNPGLALAGYQRFLPLSPDTIIEQAVRQRIDLLLQNT